MLRFMMFLASLLPGLFCLVIASRLEAKGSDKAKSLRTVGWVLLAVTVSLVALRRLVGL